MVHKRTGFSLMELAITLAIGGLMLGFVLQSNQSAVATECTASTRSKVMAIGGAVERFARKTGRLPLPADRKIGVENVNYGREALAANITQTAGVSFGAVPFQALGLPVDYASDCWGNKLTYMVTTAITTGSGYLDDSVQGNISLKSSTTITVNPAIAYAILSHGEDQLGAVKSNYAGATPNWCSGASTLATMNCRASAAEVAGGTFNNGKDAGANYFDDIVLAAGKPQILQIPPKGNPYCWGDNTYGQIGDGTVTSSTIPVEGIIPTGENQFTAIAAGLNHTCGITNSGKAYCWGKNDEGQLGDGTTTTRQSPTLVSGGLTFNKIYAGGNNTCAIATNDNTYCWGYDASGSVGNGVAAETRHTTPQLVTGGHAFIEISVGYGYVCAIKENDAVYCWGSNDVGQLGDNSTTNRESPTAVFGAFAAASIASSSTGSHSCAVKVDGSTYCWGNNAAGQLGDGTTANKQVPTLVPSVTYAKITAGYAHTCAVTVEGAPYCWGQNNVGQLGDNTTTDSPTPVAVADSHRFTRITAAASATCGRELSDKVYCWGQNNVGQLGDETTTNRSVPVLVSGSGSTPLLFESIANGASHGCALADADYSTRLMGGGPIVAFIKNSGEVWRSEGYEHSGWSKESTGSDFYAKLVSGRGATKLDGSTYYLSGWDMRIGPLVAFPMKYETTTFTYDTFFGITRAGRVFYNRTYEGGWPTKPTWPTISATRYKQFSDGSAEQWCLVRTNRDAECKTTYGNGTGQAGNGTFSAGNVWSTVTGGAKWLKVLHTNNGACGIQIDNSLWCWGYNATGRVGDGTTTNRAAPVKIGNLKWKSIARTAPHWNGSVGFVCGVTLDGDGYCWGESTNGNSNLGADVDNYATTPQKVAGNIKWLHIAPNAMSTCGISINKTIYCWGGRWYFGWPWHTHYTPTKVPAF